MTQIELEHLPVKSTLYTLNTLAAKIFVPLALLSAVSKISHIL